MIFHSLTGYSQEEIATENHPKLIQRTKNATQDNTGDNSLLFASTTLTILPIVNLKHDVFAKQNSITFIHAPKTGGSNVAYLMKAIAIEQKAIQFGISTSDAVKKSQITTVKPLVSELDMLNNHPNCHNCIKKNIKFTYGHAPFPSVKNFQTDVSYISLVRDPIDRLLSLANFLYQRGTLINQNDIENYILNIEPDNLQTRYLAGEEYMMGECTEATFKKAIDNIKNNFVLVAPTEETNTVMAIIASHFGIKNIAIAKAQVTKVKLVTKENTDLCEKIKARNYYDLKLSQFVKENWNLWKTKNILSIEKNKNTQEKYLVITPEFYKTRQIDYMTLPQIEAFGQGQEELVGVTQNHF